MSNSTLDRVANALRAEWQDESLRPDARERIGRRVASAHRRRRRRLIAVPAVALVVVAFAVSVVPTTVEDGARASEVRERAGAAVAPRDDVLHYVATIRQDHSAGGSGSADVVLTTEVWEYPAERRSRTLVSESGRLTTEIVTSADGALFWSARDGGPREFRPEPSQGAPAPSDIPPFAASSLGEIRAALPGGRVLGPRNDRATGREVYEIETTAAHPHSLGTWRTDYLVDADTYAPVRLVRTLLEAPSNQVSPRPGDTVTTEFTLVERLSPEEAAPDLRGTWAKRRR